MELPKWQFARTHKLPEPVAPNSEVEALTIGVTSLTKIKSEKLGSQTEV